LAKRRGGTRADRIVGLDGRSKVAQCIRDTRRSLLDSLPQPVSAADACLVERVAIVTGHLLELDRKALDGGLSATEGRMFVMLSGQHARLLKVLRAARSTRPTGPTLDEIFGTEGAAA